MMEEISSSEPGVDPAGNMAALSGGVAGISIAQELEEAARTDVTRANKSLSPDKSPPRDTLSTSFEAQAVNVSPSSVNATIPQATVLPTLPVMSTTSVVTPSIPGPSMTPGSSSQAPPQAAASGAAALGPLGGSAAPGATMPPPSGVGGSTAPGATMPPPSGGFVPGSTSLTPQRAFDPVMSVTAPVATPHVAPTAAPDMLTPTAAPQSAPSPYSNPYAAPQQTYQPTQPVASPYGAAAAANPVQPGYGQSIDVQIDDSPIGPVYPTPQESSTSAGLFGWFSGSQIVNKVVEKTKSSVETMITTLDPGMKEVINSGGDVHLVVTSAKEVKVSAVRQAFQEVFGRATVYGQPSDSSIAPQPVGYTSAVKGAEERIENLRRQEVIGQKQPAISVENFIQEVLPDRWYDMACVLLRDPANNIELTTFSQATPIPSEYVIQAQTQTASDYDQRWSGYAVTIGQVIQSHMPHVDPVDWHQHTSGVSRHQMIYLAARQCANMYQQRLPVHLR